MSGALKIAVGVLGVAFAGFCARAEVVETPKMRLEFDGGWLTKWTNKETKESVEFGKAALDPAKREDLPHVPGAWVVDRLLPKDLTTVVAATWNLNVKPMDDTAAVLVEDARRPGGEVEAVQWGLNLPYDRIDAFHYPRGLAPARIAAKDSPGSFFETPNYYFNGRPGDLSFHGWRQRYYMVQGRTGGLLIYVDDPQFEHRPALEFRKTGKGLVLSNRSIKNPPWTDSYTGCRWVIRQYNGWVNAGAQIYQDYLMRAYGITPLKDRPTGWVTTLAYCNVKPGMGTPLPFPGKPNTYNFSTDWEKTIAHHTQWLQNAAQVLKPASVMIYDTGWNYSGMDSTYPDHSINPLLAYTMPVLRGMGYHYMLHFNCHFAYAPSAGFKRFIENQWKQQGREDMPGLSVCALRNSANIKKDDRAGSHFYRQGIDYELTRYGMTPAYEGWRRLWVAMVVSAIKATGADMIHVDVPSIPIELHNDWYGMNAAQGLHEQFKLLRETLDANGLKHVAIATELTPSEPILPYVDLYQASRGSSALGFLNNPAQAGEILLELQTGEDLTKIEKQRATQDKKKLPPFDVELYRKVLSSLRDLGEPSIDAMVTAKFARGYPHLGTVGPLAAGAPGDPNAAIHNHAVEALTVWYTFTHDTILHDILGPPAFMDSPKYMSAEEIDAQKKSLAKAGVRKNGKVLDKFYYTKFALARFWQDTTPIAVEPQAWERGDIGRYRLKDGRVLRITRAEPLVMRFAFTDGSVLADLHLFEGWKNCDRLTPYEPTWLRDQIDEFANAK